MEKMKEITRLLLDGEITQAKSIALEDYPFKVVEKPKRNHDNKMKLQVFIRDGFIDRYSGERLYHPGFLRILNLLLPEAFPYHKNGKGSECHPIYWDLLPSLDHIDSLHRGGINSPENYITTSIKRNMAKNNWSTEALGWKIWPAGNFNQWDGMTLDFLNLQEKYKFLDSGVKIWYRVTKEIIEQRTT